MTILRRLLTAFAVLMPLAATSILSATAAEKRFALVIGNEAYRHMASVRTAPDDATAMSSALATAGFRVTKRADLGLEDMRTALRDFSAAVAADAPQTVALIFFAGQGMQVGSETFLIPIDAKITRESELRTQALALKDMLATIEAPRGGLRLMIIDAPRTNPFSAGQQGSAIVDAPTDTFIGYSTAPGAQVADSSGPNGHYATALIQAMTQKGPAIDVVFKEARRRVHEATGGRQTPWESNSLSREFSFFPPSAK